MAIEWLNEFREQNKNDIPRTAIENFYNFLPSKVLSQELWSSKLKEITNILNDKNVESRIKINSLEKIFFPEKTTNGSEDVSPDLSLGNFIKESATYASQKFEWFVVDSDSVLAKTILDRVRTFADRASTLDTESLLSENNLQNPSYHLYIIPVDDSHKGRGYVPIVWGQNFDEQISDHQILTGIDLLKGQLINLENPIYERDLFFDEVLKNGSFLTQFQGIDRNNIVSYFQKENSRQIMTGLLKQLSNLLVVDNYQEFDEFYSSDKGSLESVEQGLKSWLDFVSYLQRNDLVDSDIFKQLNVHDKQSQVLIDILDGYGGAKASRIIPHLVAEELSWDNFINYVDDLAGILFDRYIVSNPNYGWLKSRLGENFATQEIETVLQLANWEIFLSEQKNLGYLFEQEMRNILTPLAIFIKEPHSLTKRITTMINNLKLRYERLLVLQKRCHNFGIFLENYKINDDQINEKYLILKDFMQEIQGLL